MGLDDVAPVRGLGELVIRFAGEEVGQSVMEGSERVADLSAEELAAWLQSAIDRLDAEIPENTRTAIMETMGLQCAEMNRGHIEQALVKRQSFDSLEAFLEAEEKHPSRGTRLVREADTIYQCYDPQGSFQVRCFCSLWRGLAPGNDVSSTWCQCAKGFVMKLWEAYVGKPVRVDLVDSCIAGAGECRFRIHLPS